MSNPVDSKREYQSQDAAPVVLLAKRNKDSETAYPVAFGMGLSPYDYVSMALSGGDTTETYTFKTGGSGGTTVGTITIVYTSSSRDVMVSATRT